MNELLKLLGLFTIGSSIIVSVVIYFGKKILDQYLKRDLVKFKNKLFAESEKTRLEIENQIENHKATLNLFNSKQIELYSKQSVIIEKLYKKLILVHDRMQDMTLLLRNVTGLDTNKIINDELKRVQETADSGNDFFNYYRKNKIYFKEDTCLLIESIQIQFKEVHTDYSFKHLYGLPPSEMTYELAKKANEKVIKEIPILMNKLEKDFRESLGVIYNGVH